MSDRDHHPDCPALFFRDHPERCRCVFMSMLDAPSDRICDHNECCTYRLCAHPKCCGYSTRRPVES